MEWQAAEASVLPESVGVAPAALSRSSEGLTAHWPPWKRLGMADGMAFGPELAYMGMAWQSCRGNRLQMRWPSTDGTAARNRAGTSYQ